MQTIFLQVGMSSSMKVFSHSANSPKCNPHLHYKVFFPLLTLTYPLQSNIHSINLLLLLITMHLNLHQTNLLLLLVITRHNAPEPLSNQPSSPTCHNAFEPPSDQPSSPTRHNAPEPPADQPSSPTPRSLAPITKPSPIDLHVRWSSRTSIPPS